MSQVEVRPGRGSGRRFDGVVGGSPFAKVSGTLLFAGLIAAAEVQAAPSLTQVNPANGPTAGSTVITLTGSSFSASGNSVKVDGNDCDISSEGTNSILCSTPEGSGRNKSVVVFDDTGTSSNSQFFSYDAATLSTITPANGPGAGNTRLTIHGNNFGPSDLVRSVSVGSLPCTLAAGLSTHTDLYCDTPAGTGANNTVAVTIDGQAATNTKTYSYDAPTVSGVSPSNGPKAGNVTITVQGANFGPAGTLRSISIGGNACPAVSGQDSDGAVTCTLPAGQGTNKSVAVTVVGQSSSGGATFSYDGPALASVLPANGPTTGGTLLTLSGSSFSASGNTITVDGAACTPTAQGYSLILCTAPAGTGATNNVVVTDAVSSSSDARNFAYDAPTVGSVTPANGPTASVP